MYNPERFKSRDQTEAVELMDRNPFATVITVADGRPFISHLPLTPRRRGDRVELVGHLARANPHWRWLASAPTTAVFHGPQTYITPRWYAENDVPTWNYTTVHVTGPVELIESHDGIVDCLRELTAHVERHWPSGWEFFIPEDLTGDTLAKSIVGFRMPVEAIDFKKKLSQNRSAADRAGVMRGLEARTDDESRAVANEMTKLYGSGEPVE